MPEETRIIEKIKELRNTPNKKKFWADFRMELAAYVSSHPAKDKPRGFWNMNRLNMPHIAPFNWSGSGYFQKAAAAAVIIIILGTSGVAFASQNSLPGNTLYPVKLLTEDIRSSLTVSPGAKAKLQTDFAARRVGEVKLLLEENVAEPQKIDIAMSRLQQNASNAVNIVNSEKQKGADVSGLAKTINDNLEESRQALDNMLKEQKNNLEKQAQDLQTQITTSGQAGDAAQVKSLSNHLGELTDSKKTLETNLSTNEELLKEKSTDVVKNMDEESQKDAAKKSAEQTIEAAKETATNRQDLLAKAAQEQTIKQQATDALSEFDTLLANANQSFLSGDYSRAQKYAESAIEKFGNAEKLIESGNTNNNTAPSPSPSPSPSGKTVNGDNQRHQEARSNITTENGNPSPLPLPSPSPSIRSVNSDSQRSGETNNNITDQNRNPSSSPSPSRVLSPSPSPSPSVSPSPTPSPSARPVSGDSQRSGETGNSRD